MSLYQLNLMDVLEIKMSKDYLEAMKLCGILKAELDTGMKNVIGECNTLKEFSPNRDWNVH